MKNSKRILGVALALIMIFNIFAIGTFAAFPDDTLVKLSIKSDKAVYAPGETVTLTFAAQAHDELDLMCVGGQYEIAYPTAAFDLVAPTSQTLEDHGFVALQEGYDASISVIQLPGSVGSSGISDNAYGWDENVCWCVGDDLGTTTFSAKAGVDLFTINMKIADDAADGTYVIGFNPLGYEECNAYSNDGLGLGGLYGISAADYGFSVPNMYEFGTCEITVGEASTDPIVYPVKRQIQWADKDANTVNLGIVSGFDVDDIEIAFNDEGTSTNVKAVGATVTFEGADPQTKYERFVYAADETKSAYHFRAVLTNIPADYSGTITIAPFVMMTNGDTYEAEVITIDAATFASYVGVLNA